MRKVTLIIIVIAIVFIVFGYIISSFGLLNERIYFNISAIIGVLASIFSLLTFVVSGIKKRDFETAGIEYLKDIIAKSEELKIKEAELLAKKNDLTQKENEIKQLDFKKSEIEYLIQKSSMVLFLKDQHGRIQEQIDKIINDKELIKLFDQLDKLELKISALDAEISINPNVKFLRSVIEKINGLDLTPRMRMKKTFVNQVISFFEDEPSDYSMS